MKLHVSSFMSKLIWFGLLLGTFPVIVLGIFSYYTASSTLQTKMYESNQQMLQQTELRIEQLLRLIDYSAIQYMNQPRVITALRENMQSDASSVRSVHDLIDGMNTLLSSELGAMNMELISLTNKWSVSDTGLTTLSDSEMREFDHLVNDPRTSFWIASPSAMMLVKKIPAFSSNPTGLIILSIPQYEINKLITRDKKSHVLVMNDTRFVFAGNDATVLGKQFDVLPYGGKLISATDAQGYYSTRTSKERVGISYLKSAYNGWIYVSIISIDELNKEYQDIGWFTIIICLSILAVALLISYLGSRKMYKPIRRLYEAVRSSPEFDGLEVTKDEFEFMNERFRGLLQQEHQLLQEMQGQSYQIKEYFVFKLFQSDTDKAEIHDKLELFEHPLRWKDMSVMSIQIDTLAGTRFQEQDRDLLMFALNNMVSELIDKEYRLLPVVMGESQVTLIGSSVSESHQFKAFLDAKAQHIMSMVKQYLELKISIGFSRVFNDVKDIRIAYKESLSALNYRMKLGEESILFIEEVQPDQEVPQNYPDVLEQQLLDALKVADREQTSKLLPQIIATIASDERTHEAYFMSFIRLLLQILQAIKDAGVNPNRLYVAEQELFIQLFNLKTAKQVEQWFQYTVVAPIVEHLEQRRNVQYQSISVEIIRMIESGFDTDLTLEVCARRMNYSPNYLTKVFRKETGINFSEYLSEYRMKMAKKWLVETDMKISEIAEKLKYNTSANFIRYFRKLEGCTPGQYRENYLNN
ncbi:helix-turn-helix domain-containing protein [Paenibacillus periandrae]|uniref:helix-turn-helix domain-containing protein n=1 Tax=Paenibacillus periandrae TaxID=1761741 RepID=UPI001F098AFA|nr:helix-turn-helix domain-containing protein [Paenibacillus periandrae]